MAGQLDGLRKILRKQDEEIGALERARHALQGIPDVENSPYVDTIGDLKKMEDTARGHREDTRHDLQDLESAHTERAKRVRDRLVGAFVYRVAFGQVLAEQSEEFLDGLEDLLYQVQNSTER